LQVMKELNDPLNGEFEMHRILNRNTATILFLLFCVNAVFSQEAEEKVEPKAKSNKKFVVRLSEQDLIIPVTSIEWGIPDRWSFTSTYAHEFDKNRDRKTWHHNLCVTISPGISGGRLGLGYLNIFDPKSGQDFGLLSQARIVLLRTWGNPLSTSSNRTFLGGEIRSSLTGLLNLGIGYYIQMSDSEGDKDNLFGFHIGIGI